MSKIFGSEKEMLSESRENSISRDSTVCILRQTFSCSSNIFAGWQTPQVI